MKILIDNQYSTSKFEGTKKEVLSFLRNEAYTKRRESRQLKGLPDNVMSIDEGLHNSKLVTMASFKINSLDVNCLIKLLNSHGVVKFKVA